MTPTPEASQVAELIQKLQSIAVHINDRHNHSNLPPVAMGWCEEAIDFLRLYLKAVKEVPEERHYDGIVNTQRDIEQNIVGFNDARSQFIPLLMERDREIEELKRRLK